MSQHEILRLLRDLGGTASTVEIVSSSEQRGTRLSRGTIRDQLRSLRRKGEVHKTGETRNVRWHLGGEQ